MKKRRPSSKVIGIFIPLQKWGVPVFALVALLSMVGCSVEAKTGEISDKLSIVATTSIVNDWIKVVGGENVESFSLLPRQADPHAFQPGANDVAKIADADAIFAVGAGLESAWLENLIVNASADKNRLYQLIQYVEPRSFQPFGHENLDEDEEAEESQQGHAHQKIDPHFWLDPLRAKEAVVAIADKLSLLAPQSSELFRENALTYVAELDALDAWIVTRIGEVPLQNRVISTSHDALGYYADRYGLKIVGVVIPSGGTGIEPSAARITELVSLIQEHKAKAIFTEVSVSNRIGEVVAAESGVKIVSGLYTDSVGPEGSDYGTYLGVMRHNTRIFVEALK